MLCPQVNLKRENRYGMTFNAAIPTGQRAGFVEADQIARLRLIRSRRVGAVTFHRLMNEHGSAAAALDALPGIASAAGIDRYEVCPMGVVLAELNKGRAAGATLIVHGDPRYPALLAHLADAPPVLWVQGDLTLLARPMVALVGSRNASSLGLRMARRLAEGLGAAGQIVVSGLARGIDAEAHRASLATGTIAVQAGGVDVIYPAENAELAADIAARGCRLSEQPMGAEPQSRHFPLRNNIIAGLSRAVVVVEAAARSGSLLTARAALDLGREVLAVPGHPFDARAAGSNMLIRDGATLIRGAQDVLAAIGATYTEADPGPAAALPAQVLPGPAPVTMPLADASVLHSLILARLGPSPLAEDQLIRDLALPPSQITGALVTLELEGQIERQQGGLLARID
jgi:DNA processing protein